MKRLLSLLLAIAFCFALAAPSMAASSDVDDAMRAYAEIVAQAENYDFGYSEFQLDSKTFQYAVINLADAKGMPTLLLQMSVSSGMLGFMDSTRVFQYNPSSKTIMAPTNSLTSGVASSGGFRGGIGLCNGQLSTQSWQAMSGEGWIDLYSLINGELESTTIWSGKYDQVPDYLHMETISWKSIDDTADFEAFQVSTALPAAVAVSINGVTVQWTDAAPFIDVNNRTMVPLRAVAEALGLSVDWDGAMREAVFTDGTKTIYFPIGSTSARTGDGGMVQMDTAAVIVNDRTYAPIRYLAEFFGYAIDWDAATRTVLIRQNSATVSWSDAYRDFVMNYKFLDGNEGIIESSDLTGTHTIVPEISSEAFLHDLDSDGIPELFIGILFHYPEDESGLDYYLIAGTGWYSCYSYDSSQGNEKVSGGGSLWGIRGIDPIGKGIFLETQSGYFRDTFYFCKENGKFETKPIAHNWFLGPDDNGTEIFDDVYYAMEKGEYESLPASFSPEEIEVMGWDAFLSAYGYQ